MKIREVGETTREGEKGIRPLRVTEDARESIREGELNTGQDFTATARPFRDKTERERERGISI